METADIGNELNSGERDLYYTSTGHGVIENLIKLN
mgnify:CR=1 FL=1